MALPMKARIGVASTLGVLVTALTLYAVFSGQSDPKGPSVASVDPAKTDPSTPGPSTPGPSTPSPSTPTPQEPLPPPITWPPDIDPPTEGSISPAAVAKVKKATVHFRVTQSTGAGEGSGFFAIDKGYIITNAHVLGMLESEGRPPSKIEITINRATPEEKEIGGQVLAVDRDADLALVKAVGFVTSFPEPLTVRLSEKCNDLQKLWGFGFPLGSRLGKEMSTYEATVASKRRDEKSGIIQRLQINGNAQPGNSGGPVVDARGDVVGVLASGVVGTGLNFCVPGEQVRALVSGRAGSLSLGQPYVENGTTRVPVSLTKLDPLGRMRELAVDVWTGTRGANRPASLKEPQSMPGDSTHSKAVLSLRGPSPSTGEVTLPNLPSGTVYWIQPRWIDGSNKPSWGEATVWEMKSPPVERRPILLQTKHQAGDRNVTLACKYNLKVGVGGGTAPLTSNFQYQLTESTKGPEASGGAAVTVKYKEFKYDVSLGGHGIRFRHLEDYNKHIAKLEDTLHLDATGQLKKHDANRGGVPSSQQKMVNNWHQLGIDPLIAFAIPTTNEMTQPQRTWKSSRKIPLAMGGWSIEPSTVEAVYTYVGTRKRNNREEAVIALSGAVKGQSGQEGNVAGRIEGVAVLDLASGQISEVDAKIIFDMDAAYEDRPSKANGTVEVKLTRAVS
jgi:S1-C subfamily serine protease